VIAQVLAHDLLAAEYRSAPHSAAFPFWRA
jgi:hypothetical protein